MSKELAIRDLQTCVPDKFTFWGHTVIALPTIATLGATAIVWASAPLFALAIVAPLVMGFGTLFSTFLHLQSVRKGFFEDYVTYVLYNGEYGFHRLKLLDSTKKAYKMLRPIVTYRSLIKGMYFRRKVSKLIREKNVRKAGDKEQVVFEILNGKPAIRRYEVKSASTIWKEGYRNALNL